MQEAFRNQREMEWNSALAGRDEARPLFGDGWGFYVGTRDEGTGRRVVGPYRWLRKDLSTPWDGGAARRIVVPYGGKSRKGCPFLVSGACAGKNRNHFSPRRVRGEKYFSGRKCGKWPPQWGGHFMRAVGLRFHSPKAALLPWARKSLAEMFLGTFQRFKISMNSSPVMVSFS